MAAQGWGDHAIPTVALVTAVPGPTATRFILDDQCWLVMDFVMVCNGHISAYSHG